MRKLKRVDDAVALNPNLTVEEIIDKRIHDRLSRDGGRPDIMSEDEFKDAVCARTTNKHSCTLQDYHDILVEAKKKTMILHGHDPGTASVCWKTVQQYEKVLGGDDDLKVRLKVPKKTQARIQV